MLAGLCHLVGMCVKYLIFECRNGAHAERDMAAQCCIPMVLRRCFVERPRGLCPPVSEDGIMVFIRKPDTPNMVPVAGIVIYPPEYKAVFYGAQLHKPVFIHDCKRIAFRSLCRGAVPPSGAYGI